MKETTISEYLNNEYSQAAIYMSYRSLPSVIDGLKSSGRKIVYTIKKNNIKDNIKVTSLGGKVTTDAGYLHGDSSIQGAIVTATQNFKGSNNLPYLKGEGNFGSAFTPEASAARYIFSKPQPYFYELFRKEDEVNLISQSFEGEEIEPRYYVPTIPLLLANGCTGIGVGYSCKILNRDVHNIIKILEAKLQGKRIPKSWFTPSWQGFKGSISNIEKNKWNIQGIITKEGKQVTISELPITYDYLGYISTLNKLKEREIIVKYSDYCDPSTDEFKFEVVLSEEESKKTEEEILNDLKLSIDITEQTVGINENNAIEEFDSVEDMFDRYYNIKLDYQNKKIQSEIKRLEKELSDLTEIYKFINEVIKETIVLKKKKVEVEEDMKVKKYTIIDKLLGMPLYSLTEEKALEAKKKKEDKQKELDLMKQETAESLWLKELEELEKKVD